MKILLQSLKVKVFLTAAFLLLLPAFTGCSKNKDDKALVVYPVFSKNAANSYIAAAKGEAVVIDPSDAEAIISILSEKGLKPSIILLTHGHFDHILGLDSMVSRFPEIKIFIHQADSDKPANPEKNLSSVFGSPVKSLAKITPVTKKDIIKIGDTEIKIIETPGHTQGSITLLVQNNLFTGDTLFKGSIGRTDFPGSSSSDIADSLKKIASLTGDLTIYPGHGGITSLKEEKETNPFLKEID